MTEKEAKIIECAKECTEVWSGGYRSLTDLQLGIKKIMGYTDPYEVVMCSIWLARSTRITRIVFGMRKRGLIKISQNGCMFKML